MSELYEKLNDIKKEKNNETKKKRLKEVCSDRDILNDALDIAKHESTIALPGATLITALSAILIAVMSAVFVNLISDAMLRTVSLFSLFILYYVVIWIIAKFEFERWTKLYYDLIELRRERREELDISKLDIIISKAEAINQRIDDLGKIVSIKSEAIEKEIVSLKRK